MRFTILVAYLAYAVVAFQSPLATKHTTTTLAMATKKKAGGNPMGDFLRRLTNNFEPIHGHGSLENDLEDQWEAQQEILRQRRAHHLDKAHLKQKYSDPSKVKFDGRVGDSSRSEFGKNISP
mmetsp:Transcript_14699/g.23787  ORF Transcript_14699/g.23787 Transcript_14699/m.23787 type:complete len:122 (+) Transcript_14699:28-393(+)